MVDRDTVEYAVYSAVVNSLYIQEGSDVRLAVLVDSTTVPREHGVFTWQEVLHQMMADLVSPEARSDFLQANEQQTSLAPRLTLDVPYILVSLADIHQVFTTGPEWGAFYAQYPGARGFVRLSRVGLNPASDEAIVYLEHRYGNLGARGGYAYLERKDSTWLVKLFRSQWGS